MKMKHLISVLALLVTGCGQPSFEGEKLFSETRSFFEKHPEQFSPSEAMETLEQSRRDGDKAWQIAAGLHACYMYRSEEMSQREADRVRLLAIAWFQYAAELGSPYARVDMCFPESLFWTEDPPTPEQRNELADKAFKTLMEREPKSPTDMQYLAACYLQGIGVAPDPDMAYTWFERFVHQVPASEESRRDMLDAYRRNVEEAKAAAARQEN